jgi:hypothetical protein
VIFALALMSAPASTPPGRRDGATFTRGKASMLNFNINLTSLAIILWSGMLVIAGSIWVLSSQVRKLADIMEDQSRSQAALERSADGGVLVAPVRVARRGAPVRVRGGSDRRSVTAARRLAQLAPPERALRLAGRLLGSDSGNDRPRS